MPKQRCNNLLGNKGVETFGKSRLQFLSDACGATTAIKVAFSFMAPGHQVDAEEILQAEEKDSGSTASNGCAAEVAKHFGILHEVEIGHGQPSR
jgi:hypothetical protein